MANLHVVSKYNCYSFCFLPHTLTRQSPRGSLAVDGACAVATRGEAAQICLKTGFGQLQHGSKNVGSNNVGSNNVAVITWQ